MASNGDVVVMDLPNDIIYNILCRLPTKSLVRFQCVSKNWLCMTQDPCFVDMQLRACLNYKPCSFIVAPSRSFHESNCLTLIEKTIHGYKATCTIPIIKHPTSKKPIKHPTSKKRNFDNKARIVSCCNGLVCIESTDSIFVYNPITNESIELPRLQKLEKLQSREMLQSRQIYLGFDVSTRKYKVVCFNFYKKYRYIVFNSGDIITLDGTSWRTLNLPRERPGDSLGSGLHSVFSEGAFHWLIKEGCEYEQNVDQYKHILAMDIDKENFRAIELPKIEKKFDKMEVTNLGTSVALIGYTELHTCIWKLVNSKKGSWSHLYKYDTSPIEFAEHQPLFMLSEHGMLMRVWELMRYESSTSQIGTYNSRYSGSFEIILGLPWKFDLFPFTPNFVFGLFRM